MELTRGPKEREGSRTTLRWSNGGRVSGERDGFFEGRFGAYKEEVCVLFLEVEVVTLPVWSERPSVLLPAHVGFGSSALRSSYNTAAALKQKGRLLRGWCFPMPQTST